jgi:hypothetical protein
VAIRNIYNLHCTITEKLQKYTDLTEELVRISQLKTAYIITLILSTLGYNAKQITHLLKLLPAVHILMQTAVILHTWRLVRKFCAEQGMLGQWDLYSFQNQRRCCEVTNVDVDDEDDDNNDNKMVHIISACIMLAKEQYIQTRDRLYAELHCITCKRIAVTFDK